MLACFVVLCAAAPAPLAGVSPDVASASAGTNARLAAIRRLSPAQFRAIERVYVASLPLDKFRGTDTPSPSKLEAATRGVLKACLKLSTRDPLLRALRAGCPSLAEFTDASTALAECSSSACLTRALKTARSTLRRVVSGSRASDRAVNATRLASGCKSALITPRDGYVAYDQHSKAFAKLERALATSSAADLAAAEAALAAADRASARTPTAKRLLQRLRSGCR
jgi:hypothetical protein